MREPVVRNGTQTAVAFDHVRLPFPLLSGTLDISRVQIVFAGQAPLALSGSASPAASLVARGKTIPVDLGDVTFAGRLDTAANDVVSGALTFAHLAVQIDDSDLMAQRSTVSFQIAADGRQLQRLIDLSAPAMTGRVERRRLAAGQFRMRRSWALAADGTAMADQANASGSSQIDIAGFRLAAANGARAGAGAISFKGDVTTHPRDMDLAGDVTLSDISWAGAREPTSTVESAALHLSLRNFRPDLLAAVQKAGGGANLAGIASALDIDLTLRQLRLGMQAQLLDTYHAMLSLRDIGANLLSGRVALSGILINLPADALRAEEQKLDKPSSVAVSLGAAFERLPTGMIGLALPLPQTDFMDRLNAFGPQMAGAGTILRLENLQIENDQSLMSLSAALTGRQGTQSGYVGQASLRLKTGKGFEQAQAGPQLPKAQARIAKDGSSLYEFQFQPSQVLINGRVAGASPPPRGTALDSRRRLDDEDVFTDEA